MMQTRSDSPAHPGTPARAVRMIVTDLDGTLLDARHRLCDRNRETLEALAARGVTRVVATGRSLYSARSVLDGGFPIDYLVFASGAGVLDWASGTLIEHSSLTAEAAEEAIEVLLGMDADFMIHAGVPENHRFVFRASGRANPDFVRRCVRYDGFAEPWDRGQRIPFESISQLLAVEPPDCAHRYVEASRRLAQLTVIRATSPLDHRSIWIEIFPPDVSKDQTAHRVAERLGIGPENIVAVGNDYNDIALLDWAARAYVVANAPAELRARYATVADHDAAGFSEAVRHALEDC
jgi:hydroxymethylpyrimidine pyrophosphatase-like HAD family hydrolase